MQIICNFFSNRYYGIEKTGYFFAPIQRAARFRPLARLQNPPLVVVPDGVGMDAEERGGFVHRVEPIRIDVFQFLYHIASFSVIIIDLRLFFSKFTLIIVQKCR